MGKWSVGRWVSGKWSVGRSVCGRLVGDFNKTRFYKDILLTCKNFQ